MALTERAGSLVSALNGAWAAYIALVEMNTPTSCPAGGCPVTPYTYLPSLLLVVALILVVDSLVSVVGFRISFTLGALLSAVVLILVVAQWGSYGMTNASVAAAISLIAVVVDLLASRRRSRLSEQVHPLNLPVFG